ncbi:MAG TPA: hypothetical protein DDW52_18715, partial [Planctomycetaceae bacterium]|nr:hypothetical protein [Planctomycetaceae bacterium]
FPPQQPGRPAANVRFQVIGQVLNVGTKKPGTALADTVLPTLSVDFNWPGCHLCSECKKGIFACSNAKQLLPSSKRSAIVDRGELGRFEVIVPLRLVLVSVPQPPRCDMLRDIDADPFIWFAAKHNLCSQVPKPPESTSILVPS